jgi:fission process protein 1
MAANNKPKLTINELNILKEIYDENKDNSLSDEELENIMKDAKENKNLDPRVKKILEKYDDNKDGVIDDNELKAALKDMKMTDGLSRYAGYSAGLARLFRYLAFTSDFGEALRPVVSSRIVNITYGISIGYCFADVGWEAHKHKKRGYITENGVSMSMTQVIVERSVFQAIASIAVPFLVIHTTVDIATKIFKKYLPKYTRFGPSIVGLSIIPLLPMYLDHPVEHALEKAFQNFGPWANNKKTKSD